MKKRQKVEVDPSVRTDSPQKPGEPFREKEAPGIVCLEVSTLTTKSYADFPGDLDVLAFPPRFRGTL
jgi:hypothetical protein